MIFQTAARTAIAGFILVMLLMGCGGSNASTPNGSVHPPPIADAGPDQTVNIAIPYAETITLTGAANDSESIIAHQWVQTGGPSVDLVGTETPTASFSVPATTEVYTFSYTVTNKDGAQATDDVTVYATRIVFSDIFSDGDTWTDRWTPVDDTGRGADWLEINGQLRQSKNLGRAFLNRTSYHLGTYAVLDSSIMPSSYRFSVDIKPLPDTLGSEQGNDVGMMFRYTDPNNYYRVSMNARCGFTRFEKRENGNFQTLAVNAIGYVDNQPMTMTVEVNGDTLIVWIDGDAVFAFVDNGISSGTIALYCQNGAEFSNVLITENPLQPKVVLSTPLAYSVAPTEKDIHTLTAEAVVLNKPDGGSVEFTLLSLDGGEEATEPGKNGISVHFVEFSDVAEGEHDMMAVLKDAVGREVSRDINLRVGLGGDYYVTVGASITNGMRDQNPLNNESTDGRIVAIQGYQAELADLLTTTTGLPQIVFNEGIGGDRSSDLKERFDSILERHPGANKVLLLIGTNDSGSSVPPDTFESNILSTVAQMNGRQLWLAKTLPAFKNDQPISWTLDTTRNSLIQEYNSKMSQIAEVEPDTFPGPDFYTDFSDRIDLYADYLHPNDAGYVLMAEQWHVVLSP